MACSNLPDELRKALARHRLPPAYARRLMDELSDHLSDLKEEYPYMEPSALANRLGDPVQLAQVAATEYRRRSFVGRHPILTFVVAPIPSVVALIVMFLLLLASICWLAPDESMHSSPGIAATSLILAVVAWTLRLLPFSLAALLFWRAASRAGCDWQWGLAASFLVALFAGAFAVNYETPTAAPDSGRFTIALGLSPAPVQLLQFCVPIAIVLWQARRRLHRSPVAA